MKKTLLFAAVMTVGGLLFPSVAQTPTDGEEIDLGLSVNWRGYDLGAAAPQETGPFYAYGITSPSDYSYQQLYPFFSYSTFAVSFPVNDISGDPQYDAAAAESGGLWRTPTKAEWEELLDGCTAEITVVEGVEGFLFTSKSNGNSVFMASNTQNCCRYYTSVNDGKSAYYIDGNKWQSLAIRLPEAWGSTGPWKGFPIRPVCQKNRAVLESIELSADRTDIFVNTYAVLTAKAVPEEAVILGKYSSSDESVAVVDDNGVVKGVSQGSAVITLADGDVSASVTINVTAVETDITQPSVDLGLSVDWMNMNEQAQSVSDYGTSYAFAIPTSKTFANAFSYPYYDSPNYHFPIENFAGDPAYDAIAYNNGEDSRMRLPTKDEFQELIDNCPADYVEIDGYNYVRFTSSVNGKYVLFPMRGTNETYYSGSCTEDLSKAYAFYLSNMNETLSVMVYEMNTPYRSNVLRGVVERLITPDLEEISLDVEEAEVYTENTVRIKASAVPMGALLDGLVWSSSDESVAVVDENGVVMGVSEGTVIITASLGEIIATATVTVNNPGISTDEMVDMGTGILWSPFELGASSPAETGAQYYWGALEPRTDDIADMEQWTDPGIDDIAATEYDVIYKTKGNGWRIPNRSEFYELAEKSDFEWIVNEGRRGVLITSKITGNRLFFPLVDGKNFVYYYGAEIFRNNSSDGQPIVEGLYIIDDRMDNTGQKPWIPYPMRPVFDPSFVPPLEQIVITSDALTLYDNSTLQLTASAMPVEAKFKELVWKSSDETVATVDSDGLVTGVSEGIVIITATDGDISAEIELSVLKYIPPLESISIVGPLEVEKGETIRLKAIAEPEEALFENLTWTSSDESIATVDAGGLVYGVSAGVVKIIAADSMIKGDVEITVTDMSGISAIVSDSVAVIGIFTLDGRRIVADGLKSLAPGVYIVRMHDGRAEKIYIR